MIVPSRTEKEIRPLERGLLVVLEGIDGAGKTSQWRRLSAALKSLGVPCRAGREPTDGPFGRRLRASATEGRLSAAEELELFIKDRQQDVQEFIEPGLAAGEVVVLDRYYFSNAAYQGSRGLDWREILRRNESFAPRPDLLLLLDLPLETSADRILNRGERGTEFEKREWLERCRDIYLQIRDPALRRIDATAGVEAVAAAILTEMQDLLVRSLVSNAELGPRDRLDWIRRWTIAP